MKLFSLVFKTDDLNLEKEVGDVIPTAQELTKRIVIVAVREYAKTKSQNRGSNVPGLLKPERKQSVWLSEELEKAAATELKELELPDDIAGFIRKVFRETPLPAMDRILDRVEVNVDNIRDR